MMRKSFDSRIHAGSLVAIMRYTLRTPANAVNCRPCQTQLFSHPLPRAARRSKNNGGLAFQTLWSFHSHSPLSAKPNEWRKNTRETSKYKRR